MAGRLSSEKAAADPRTGRDLIRLAGILLLGGLLIYVVSTLSHPGGSEDDHEAIFTEYAESGDWIAVHTGQFVGFIILIGGLLVLYRALRARDEVPVLGLLGAAGAIATGATFALLQAQDGIALKYAVDTWIAAAPAEQPARFADAESLRWLEWGIQSYFRILFGVTLGVFGAAIMITRVVTGWLGWLAMAAGALSIASGIDVGYQGLESGFQDLAIGLFQLALLVFAIGVLVAGVRRREAGVAS